MLGFCLFSCSGGNEDANKSETKLPGQLKERKELQKEVLFALFSAPEKSEELPERTQKAVAVRRSRAFGTVVSEPPRDFIPEPKVNVFPWQENSTIGMYSVILISSIVFVSVSTVTIYDVGKSAVDL